MKRRSGGDLFDAIENISEVKGWSPVLAEVVSHRGKRDT